MAKLTRVKVLKLLESGQKALRPAWDQMDIARSIYWRTFDPFKGRKLSVGLRMYRPSFPKSVVDQAVARVVTDHPQAKHEPESQTDKAKTVSAKMEFVSQADIDGWNNFTTAPPFRECAKLGALGKWSLLGPIIDRRWLEDEPEQRKGEKDAAYELRLSIWRSSRRHMRPFTLYPRDPLRSLVHPPTTDAQPEWAIDLTTLSVAEAAEKWGLKPDKDIDPEQQVELLHYVDAEQRYFLLDREDVLWKDEQGELVKGPQPNIYRQVYFRIGYSGLGAAMGGNTSFDPNSEREASPLKSWEEARAISSLNDIEEAAYAHSVIMTAFLAYMQKHAFAKYKARGIKALDAANRMAKDIIPLDGEEDIEQLEPAQLPVFVKDFLGVVMDEQQQATYSDILRGVQPSGVTSGRQAQALISAAQEGLTYAIKDMERAAASAAEDALLYRKHIFPLLGEKSCTISGRTADGSPAGTQTLLYADIPDSVTLKVTLLAVDKADEERRKAMGIELFKAGLEDPVRVHEDYMGNQDGFKRMVSVGAWKIYRESPAITQLIEQKALEKLALKQEEAAVDKAAASLGKTMMSQGESVLPNEPGVMPEGEVPDVGMEPMQGVEGMPNPMATIPRGPQPVGV